MPHSQIVNRMPESLRVQALKAAAPGLSADPMDWLPEDLLDAVGVALGIPHIILSEDGVDYESYMANRKFFLRTKTVPLFRHEILIVLACAEPWSERSLRDYRKSLQIEVHTVGCTEMDIDRILAYLETRARSESGELKLFHGAETVAPMRGWDIDENDIQRSVRLITGEAHRLGASDIILDPMENRLRVRFRIHGVAEDMAPIPRVIADQVTGAFKAYANISSDNMAVPESGRCRVEVGGGKNIDLRVESQPTPWGSAMVMRLLDPENIKKHLGTLPFTGRDLEIAQAVLGREEGVVLVTGPTGSGKSTTLYRMLTSLDTSENNVRTIEDPVEYMIDGITQVQAPKDKETKKPLFADVLRSHLRADPDVIMVGEIRDEDTASTCIQASLTGHLILSTLHTNDAPGAIQRLMDLKISSFLIKSTLSLIIAQRLVRMLCPRCKIATTPNNAIQGHYEFHKQKIPTRIYEKCGCPQCGGLGFVGRLPVFEFLYMSPELKNAMRADMNADEFIAVWKKEGGETLAFRGLDLVTKGLTAHEDIRIFEGDYIPQGGWGLDS